MLERPGTRRTRVVLAVCAALAVAPVLAADLAPPPAASPIAVEPPTLALAGVEATVTVRAAPGEIPPGTGVVLSLRAPGSTAVAAEATGTLGDDGTAILAIVPPRSGTWNVEVRADAHAGTASAPLRAVPGWWSLLPPLVAIGLALALRQVVAALFAGVWIGAWIGFGGPWTGLLRAVDRYVLHALADRDHVSILLFSMLLGGMVGIISRSGGTIGLVEAIARGARTSARGQLTAWLLGVAVFFDDYANTLVVGNTMRPVTDRLRISREKLAFIVDSTAAPVAAIALITTWIGAEVSYIAGALAEVGSDLDAYVVFLQSIPYNFYPILALVFGFSIAISRRDFGPMLRAERRALGGQVLRDGAQPLSDFDGEALRAIEGKPHRWINAVLPVITVVGVTLGGQWWTGRAALAAAGDPAGSAPLLSLGVRGFGTVFSAGNSYDALLWASFLGCTVALGLAVVQRVLTLEQGLTAWTQGIKSMLLAFVILTLAWAIGDVCSDLHSASYVAEFLAGVLDPRLLPALVFVLSAAIAFATGTSWGTMGLLIPLAVPSAFRLTQEAGLGASDAHAIFLGAAAAVLSGSILGDHCSPISDTTVLSSMSSGCDHVDHVRTQLPYALTVGAVVMVLGYVPEAFGLSPWACLGIGSIALIAIVRFVGRPVATA